MNIELEAYNALRAAQNASEFTLSPADREKALQPIVNKLKAMPLPDAWKEIRMAVYYPGTAGSIVLYMFMQQLPRWHSPIPETCDICASKIADTFTDGATRMGPWAIMCPVCEPRIGRGLGTGRGQKYTREGDHFYKVEG